jgi:glycosyltransferase involved in cell wall biosynthesis
VIVGVDACPLVERRTGIGNFTHALLSWMYRAQPDSRFILYSNAEVCFPAAPNVTVRPLPASRRGAFWHHTRLAPALVRDKADLFWGTNGYLPLWTPARISSVLVIHDLVWHYAADTLPLLSYWSRRIFQPVALKQADAVVAVSQATSAEVHRKFGRTVDAVIAPVASERYRHAAPAERERVARKFDIEGPYLLAVGTLEPRKNLELLIRAYRSVHEQGRPLPRLVIAGRKGWLDQGLQQEIARATQGGRVRILGFVPDEDMCGLYSGATALIQPSIYEGFGMPVLEAQLCGVPALIADIPSLAEASGGIAVRFAPTFDGIRDCLARLAADELPLASRCPGDIDNSADAAGRRLWRVFEQTAGRPH